LIAKGFIKNRENQAAHPVRIPGMLLRGMSGNPATRVMKNGACLSTCAALKVLRYCGIAVLRSPGLAT
jgi:hypothetical protein